MTKRSHFFPLDMQCWGTKHDRILRKQTILPFKEHTADMTESSKVSLGLVRFPYFLICG